MRHYAAHAVSGRLVFGTWAEGLALWRRLALAVPGAPMCVMPDHLHVLAPAGSKGALRNAMRAHALWMNHRHGVTGALWRSLSDDGELVDPQKLVRSLRYVHLNPCRAGLVDDPLAWPLSTHRDLVGCSLQPVARRRRDVHDFHRYVSADPTVSVQGSELPCGNVEAAEVGDVLAAVSALSRHTVGELTRRSPARTQAIRAARAVTNASSHGIARVLGVTPRAVRYVEPLEPEAAALVRRVVGDWRFSAIVDEERPRGRWRRR